MIRDTEHTKYKVLIGILFDLLRYRKVNATFLAHKYELSTRTIYRYVDELSLAGVPVWVERGRYGGLRIPQKYKLPSGFLTKEEYSATISSLEAMAGELSDPKYGKALDKLREQVRNEQYDLSISGNILVDGTAWGDVYSFADTLTLLESAVEHQLTSELVYIDKDGKRTERTVEPLLLVLKENIWYIYAYCYLREEFRLFKVNRIASITYTGTTFEKREFDRSKIQLKYKNPAPPVTISLAVTQPALSELIEWLGIKRVNEENLTAEATLPDDDQLIDKLLGFGTKIKIISPDHVREKVVQKAKEILLSYDS